ncbi:hypothetical protein ACFGVS_03165 [Mucilaginibacter sp. AW1-7]|uniref:hypothetical protein n=1 Tax=Mucilaginibacter sp. AW1-7 TaxID=3349874 RepID=UPI003F736005
MDKPYQINDFVSFHETKPGNFKATCSPGQEGNIYRWLAAQGFGRMAIGVKIATFRKLNDDIKPSGLEQMKDWFQDYLETVHSSELPGDLNRNDLLEWYFQTMPIKANNLYRRYLKTELTAAEIHQYKLNADSIYRHKYRVSQVLDMLTDKGFKQTYDQGKTLGKDLLLYYRQVATNQFLIFSHHNAGEKNLQDGFDCWLAPFKNERQIGLVKNERIQNIIQSFQLDRDYSIIAEYLSN